MGKIGNNYGSEWHLRRCLNNPQFGENVARQVGCTSVSWLDFKPSMTNEMPGMEYQGIEFIQDPAVQAQWKCFWPWRAQHWDAVGMAHFPEGDEWLLVEAKAHAAEVGENIGCMAKSPKSREMIRAALLSTQQALGVNDVAVESWMAHYYQTCNRYAALHFLRNLCQPAVRARLVFLYFYGEEHLGWDCPASPEAWQPHLEKIAAVTGIRKDNPLAGYVKYVFFPVHGGW